MTPVTRIEGAACPLGLANVDTDQLIPARFMSRPRREGYGQFLLHDVRRRDGELDPTFALNIPGWDRAPILIARRNFGGGSSREAAVYALWDHGIRAVIAPSFGDIFQANAVKNGLLPATIPEDGIDALLAAVMSAGHAGLRVDLERCTIEILEDGGGASAVLPFTIDAIAREQLLNGWDDIDVTHSFAEAIKAFRTRQRQTAPWVVPSRGPDI
jgi:3-isopropylmalate/(R)-2-methylmalate dehydratase small subunit